MKKFITILWCLICVRTGPALGLGAKSSGWVSITPQTSLDGWSRVAIPPEHALNPVSQWKLDAGKHTIICEGNRGHEWLRYDHRYKDFIFEAQWRLAVIPGDKHYNSGIFVRNNDDGSLWYQAQVGSTDGGYFFGDNPENGAPKRFTVLLLIANHMKLPGNWNTYRIECVGKKLTLWVNGVKQSEFTECNNPEGYVGLEAEGSRIEFRRLRIKVLPRQD